MNDMKISAHVMTCWLAFFDDNRDNRDNFLHERKKGWRRGKEFQIDLSIKELSLLSLLSLKKT